MSIIKPIFLVIMIAVIVFFLGSNLGSQFETQVNLIKFNVTTYTGWVILVSAAVGALFMLPYLALREFHYRRIIRRMRKENKDLNQNVSQLQNRALDETEENIFTE